MLTSYNHIEQMMPKLTINDFILMILYYDDIAKQDIKSEDLIVEKFYDISTRFASNNIEDDI